MLPNLGGRSSRPCSPGQPGRLWPGVNDLTAQGAASLGVGRWLAVFAFAGH